MITKIKKEDLENLIENAITYKQIAKEYEVSFSTIRRLCSKYKLKSKFNELKSKNKNCLNCNIEIKTTIKEDKKFCSHSCSATFNNKKRKVSNKCLNCDIEINKINKFCSYKCNHMYNMLERVNNGKANSITMKKYLIHMYENKCMICGWCEINQVTGKVPIELEHIDGNSENNSLDNLKLLCPNCHSLTSTYKALNIGNGRHKRMERYKEGKSY